MTITDAMTRVEAALAAEFAKRLDETGCTKRSAVRLAIMDAIRADVLKPGDELPPERRLVDVLGVSLGTVQAALKQLQTMGRILRRRGDGTRVAELDAPLSDDIWHFRLLDRWTRHPLRHRFEEVQLDQIAAAQSPDATWAQFLPGVDSFIRVRRKYIMLNEVHVGAEVFIPYALADTLLTTNPADLTLINLRPFLADEFGIVATRATHTVGSTKLTRAEAQAFDLTADVETFVIEARLFDRDHKPLYYQNVYAPSDRCVLAF